MIKPQPVVPFEKQPTSMLTLLLNFSGGSQPAGLSLTVWIGFAQFAELKSAAALEIGQNFTFLKISWFLPSLR